MNNFTTLVTFLTVDQIANAKARMYGLRGIEIRGKKAAAVWEAKGFTLEKVSAQFYAIACEQAKGMYEFLNQHGVAVAVVSVRSLYDESMGAYDLATVADASGNQWDISNMYDQTNCLRTMSKEEVIAYVNAQ